ncbi:MAG: acyl-CoA thioesterase II [Saprospiraceae bacterium]|mgnify:CR=1 FL=1|jgi:acyl-CoA thioesterase-2|nr:acyl-CoA thioesterase II [Saprospiraceae bacterium]HRD81759.1 acyl-CoA thioesterase II [Saprospiraceae bacterium]HRF39542.1 acyl-CoA thioesterase II [Saprospiraceae bacterium]HRJ14766.1 acyl-CoA thioesterase II [Saprospiraceae bacterium]HRK83253.1 acyl-CoA thioesterase II [Saprospiraceae bacterium]
MKTINELLDLLQLEAIEENLFRGHSTNIGSGRVFGGQVLAQSLWAAMQTAPPGRVLHSLHSYFLLAGDISQPIIFEVDRIRDGGSFTTRRVKAIQKGKAIFLMSASFHAPEPGYDHHLNMPNVSPPEMLVSWDDLVSQYGKMLPDNIRRFLEIERPIEFKPVEVVSLDLKGAAQPVRHVWMRSKGEMPQDLALHQTVLAYASDYNLLTTALLPHGNEASFGDYMLASLDHAMWFHRDFKMDDWLLYAIDSPSASGARGFTRGSVFTRDGALVASVVQEGLMRRVTKTGGNS